MTGAREILAAIRNGLHWLSFDNSFYNLSLGGPAVKELTAVPQDAWPGRAEYGTRILEGWLTGGGQTLKLSGSPLSERFWYPADATPAWFQALHGFEWLRDLRTLGGDDARRVTRFLVIGWLDWHAQWSDATWAPPILATRIANWIGAHDFFWASADEGLRGCLLDSLGRQTRHLMRVAAVDPGSDEALAVAKGLVFGSLALVDGRRCRDIGVRLMVRALGQQFGADGGHVTRNPMLQLNGLRHLVDIRNGLRCVKAEIPEPLTAAVITAAQMLRMVRHADGGLAVFNGGGEAAPAAVELVLSRADVRVKPLRSAPHWRYERLVGGRSVLIVDGGAPASTGHDQTAHAGTLAFEFSVGKERLIVNCGPPPAAQPALRAAFAATAAHSTLVIDDTNSSEVRPEGGIGGRHPSEVTVDRGESREGSRIIATHAGYALTRGFLHRRTLWLSDQGDEVRGEDRLEPAMGATPTARPLTIRFHLHPLVTAGLIEDGAGTGTGTGVAAGVAAGVGTASGPEAGAAGKARNVGAVLLKPSAGPAWRLAAESGTLTLEESIYSGGEDEPVPTRQIVISAVAPPAGLAIRWSLRRLVPTTG